MLSFIKHKIRSILIRVSPTRMGYVILPRGLGYFHAPTIIKEANKEGLTVAEYVEKYNKGRVGRNRNDIIAALDERGIIRHYNSILEIGAGTGMYLEKFIELCKPESYEVYETDLQWSKYLKAKYAERTDLKVHRATGYTLEQTESNSINLVVAHGVFVYVPVVITFQYLQEAVRVCKTGGAIVFDCFTERILTADEIIRFREVNPDYDFPVVIQEKAILEFCDRFNLNVESKFDSAYHLTQSTYFILRKK